MRPTTLADFIGQTTARDNLSRAIEATNVRRDALDHTLLSGPPGLGKTSLANIIANELDVGFRSTSAIVLQTPDDLVSLLTNIDSYDVVFIDEIHRLAPIVEEALYPAMEDLKVDLKVGPNTAPISLDLLPFTLVGATTRTGSVGRPLRDRFGIHIRLSYYETSELAAILLKAADNYGIKLHPDAATEIALRSRGTPRTALKLLRRIRDFSPIITKTVVSDALISFGIDSIGLDTTDRTYLQTIASVYSGGPVGSETLAASLNEHRDLLDDIEPFLLRTGFIQRTPRGRKLTPLAYNHIGLTVPSHAVAISTEL